MTNFYQHNGTSYVHVSDYAALEAEIERLLGAIERAGRCLVMSNNGAREALEILRAVKERRGET